MTKLEEVFEAAWNRAQGARAKGPRAVTKSAVARLLKRQAGKKEKTSQKWKSVRAAVRQQLQTPPQVVGGDSVSEFMGRQHIGFGERMEPTLLHRRGESRVVPKHWSSEQVELQEMRDLFIMGRAHGTWVSYARWWRLFSVHAAVRGVQTISWTRDSARDYSTMVRLLHSMVNAMREKYAFGTINMLVTAVARAARDFGWANPREDEVLQGIMHGLARLKGTSKMKKMAMLGEHVRLIMAMRKAPGVHLKKWALTKAVILLGWMAFLRVSELLGSGRTRQGALKDGPTGLDVCDVAFKAARGVVRAFMEVHVRRAKNDQTGEGEVSVVYENELQCGTCAISRVQQWMDLAQLRRRDGCTKGRAGCTVCARPACVCDCTVCGKLFRSVVRSGEVRDAMSRSVLTRMLKMAYQRLEADGLVEAGLSEQVSGISLRAGGVTEAAAAGIEKEILAGHGRWKSLSGPESYDRQDKRKFVGVSNALQQSLRV